MNFSRPRWVVAALLFATGARAVPISADFTVSIDDTGGRSLGAAVSLAAGRHVTMSAGAGHSAGSDDTGNLSGTLLDAGLSLHGERGGVALTADDFADSSNYQARTVGARGWLAAGDFEIALLGRRRDLAVELTLALPQRTVRRTADFSAVGGGLELRWARGNVDAYVSAVLYDYDDDFDRFIELSRSPLLARRPRIEALVGTFLTQAQGAVERQLGAGVERAFGRHSLAIDVSSVHDAIADDGSVGLALTWRHSQSARFDWNVSGGLVDSDTWGDVVFVGFGFGIDN
jgi:hypothetical protein